MGKKELLKKQPKCHSFIVIISGKKVFFSRDTNDDKLASQFRKSFK